MSYHIDMRMTDDEDFDLTFQILDGDGTAVNTTTYTFEFVIVDEDSREIFTEDDATVTRTDASGLINILIPLATHTGTLVEGKYSLGLRSIVLTRTKQHFTGSLIVEEGFFS